jgi:hypothetical protein
VNSLIGTASSLGVAIWILYLVRNNRIMLKFAVPWLFLSTFSFIFSLSESVRNFITLALGFEQPSNAFFAVAIGSLAFLGILLSVETTSATSKLERAASAIAIHSSIVESSETNSKTDEGEGNFR